METAVKNRKIFHGNFISAPVPEQLETDEDTYCIVENGCIRNLTKRLPESLSVCPVEELGPGFIIPAFSDVHVHAPQFPNAGIGLDEKLLPWLNQYTFPLETNFADTRIC
jgi:guanine deaminase